MLKPLATALTVLLLIPALAAADLLESGHGRSSGSVTSEASQKIVSRLRSLITETLRSESTPPTGAPVPELSDLSTESLKVDASGRVHVYIYVVDVEEPTLESLRQHGVDIEIVNADFRIVQGWVPIDQLEALASEPGVTKIRPPSYGRSNAGPVTTEGDVLHRCDQARARGFTGAGVKVGVISGGVAGLAASQAVGELPTVQVLSNFPGNDEGTAMLEIVHDCAPDASLSFASAGPFGPLTSLAFIQAVNGLRNAGAQIIVDDVSFWQDPYFEDGPAALNDRAVGMAALRISSAGNSRFGHYEGVFAPSVFDPQVSGIRHDFGGGDTLLRFWMPGGSTAAIVLQWGNGFGAAADDYDVCVRQTNGAIIGCSFFVQDGNDDPLEFVGVSCAMPGPCAGDIQITLFSGAVRPLELFCFPDSCEFLQFNVAGSIFGHAAVPEVLAVAAVGANTPTTVERYSSAGPSLMLFPTVDVRFKPDLTGVDRVRTSRPGFNPFSGTSAAAPHVAGVAALVMQAMGPTSPIATVRDILQATAFDLGPAGFDFDFGFGLVDALAAIAATGVTFLDVPRDHPFWRWIDALVASGITSGCATGPPGYCPESSVRRDQMAVFLLRGMHGAGYQPPAPTGTKFTDVPLSQPFAKWIERLATEGITGGCSTIPAMYCPDAGVTRGQMAVFLLRAKHGAVYQPPAATGTLFADVPLTHPFVKWIEQLALEGVTGGCSATTYCPDTAVTRGQMAVFLVRAFHLPL